MKYSWNLLRKLASSYVVGAEGGREGGREEGGDIFISGRHGRLEETGGAWEMGRGWGDGVRRIEGEEGCDGKVWEDGRIGRRSVMEIGR